MEFKGIKNIIFDLGAVIINIDIELTIKAFAQYFNVSASQIHEFLREKSLWEEHEKGRLTDNIFLNEINLYFSNYSPDRSKLMNEEDFEKKWNTLLLDIPQERIALLKQLSTKYRLFLLSNTNHTHIVEVNTKLAAENKVSGGLESLFEKTYYSHELGLRKPDPQIYKYVLKDKSLIASETIFLDDNEQNIISAASLGIHTLHVTPPNTIIELLAKA